MIIKLSYVPEPERVEMELEYGKENYDQCDYCQRSGVKVVVGAADCICKECIDSLHEQLNKPTKKKGKK